MADGFSTFLIICMFLSPIFFWKQKFKKTAILNCLVLILFVISWRYVLEFMGETGDYNAVEIAWGALLIISLSFLFVGYSLLMKNKFNVGFKNMFLVATILILVSAGVLFLITGSITFSMILDSFIGYSGFLYLVVVTLYGLNMNETPQKARTK